MKTETALVIKPPSVICAFRAPHGCVAKLQM